MIRILDHGFVEYVMHMGDDLTPLRAARMSTGKETGKDEVADDALRERLWKDQHTSPFEMCEVVVTLQLPIFCLRQLDRHRTLAYHESDWAGESVDSIARQFFNRNEFSGRYSVMPDLFYTPDELRIMGKDPKNKQSSAGLMPKSVRDEAVLRISQTNTIAADNYKWMVENGIANEISRFVLPGTQYTKIQLKGSLLSWFKLANLRLRPDVQLETRQYMEGIMDLIAGIFPKCVSVFKKFTYEAVSFDRDEIRVIRNLISEASGHVIGPTKEDRVMILVGGTARPRMDEKRIQALIKKVLS